MILVTFFLWKQTYCQHINEGIVSSKFSWPWVDCLCSQLTVSLLESFQGVRYCGSSQACSQWLQCDFCLQVVVYPSYLLFMLAVSVVLQRDAMAISGILALQISFPTPFPPYVLITVFLFCSLSSPISHSQLSSLYFWLMLGKNHEVCLAK